MNWNAVEEAMSCVNMLTQEATMYAAAGAITKRVSYFPTRAMENGRELGPTGGVVDFTRTVNNSAQDAVENARPEGG